MTNTNKDTDNTDHFSIEHTTTTDSGLDITFQVRNKTFDSHFGKCRTGDWNSLNISIVPRCDGIAATVIDIWNICSQDITKIISSLEKVKEDLSRQEKVRKQVSKLKND